MREKVAEYISRNDGGLPSIPDDIYLTNGASEVVALAYQMLIRNPNDGIMIPIP
jgi:aspartate/methionine/tyrosine aminotransferase